MTKEALRLALEALEQLDGLDTETECVTIDVGDVIDAIKEALAQDSNRPVESNYTSQVAYTRALEEYCDKLAQPEPAIIGSYLEKDKELMENAQGDLERINLVQTGVGIGKPEQEPVGYWMGEFNDGAATLYEVPQESVFGRTYRNTPLYTTPPQRTWVWLTDREIDELWMSHHDDFGNPLSATGYERAIEAKLKEKNNG